MDLYKTTALHNQNMSEEQQKKLMKFYSTLFDCYNIKTIHDCSIGAGGTTLPLAKLGYDVSGSDLSESLLKKAKDNFSIAGYDIKLFISDFRQLADKLGSKKYDCIISTGNSLPHICNDDVNNFIGDIANNISKNGLLYIDIRNWDKILRERPIFNARDPHVMNEHEHISLYLIWNWHDDDSVNFVFATSTDRDGKHEKLSLINAPTYYPLKYEDYSKILRNNGFEIVKCYDLDNVWLGSEDEELKTGDFTEDFKYINWYGILAKKVN